MAPANRNTVKVFARHTPDCKHREHGATKCQCPKSLLIYEAARKKNRMESAHTRSWKTAEIAADNLRNTWDPDQLELARLRAIKEANQVTVAEAVALYIADMVTRKCATGTVAMARSLFGHVDPESKDLLKNGHLFDWLATIPPSTRPAYIADISLTYLTAWRAAWKFGDYTAAQRWGMTRSFFRFCETQGWISDNPARKLKRLKYNKGSRTAIFTDDQCATIVDAVSKYDPPNVPAATRKAWKQRLEAFVELLRWSGMAPIDAVQFRPEWVDADGVLRYLRQKTGELATVQLPDHLRALLRDIPMEHDSVGAALPFRMKDYSAHSDTVTWRKRLFVLFDLAGITEARTGTGRVRRPHPYMFRDTFAVWNLRHGASIYAVAKMLGHSDPTTTAKSYLPFVDELSASTIAEGRKALAQGMRKSGKPGTVVNMGNR